MNKLILASLLLTLVAFGCKSPQKAATSQPKPQIMNPKPEMEETYWKLTELMGKPIVVNEAMKKEIHIILKKEGNRVQGFSGCNTIMGGYTLKEGNRITFTGMASTMMACPDLATESEFNKMLGAVDNYSLNGNIMTLNKAKMAPMARFVAVFPK
jgi:heat shock protein HslJ